MSLTCCHIDPISIGSVAPALSKPHACSNVTEREMCYNGYLLIEGIVSMPSFTVPNFK